jgi:hypothetical protein
VQNSAALINAWLGIKEQVIAKTVVARVLAGYDLTARPVTPSPNPTEIYSGLGVQDRMLLCGIILVVTRVSGVEKAEVDVSALYQKLGTPNFSVLVWLFTRIRASDPLLPYPVL